MFSRLNVWVLRRIARRAPAPIIELIVAGVQVRDAEGTRVAVPWVSVRRVAAYKRDLYASDAIMLLLECDGPSPRLLELSEYWPGFTDLLAALERELGISPAWYVEIMVPAFEATPRVLYERPGLPPAASPPAG